VRDKYIVNNAKYIPTQLIFVKYLRNYL